MSRGNYQSPIFKDEEINGRSMRFYPVGFRVSAKLEPVLRPVIDTAAAVFSLWVGAKTDDQGKMSEADAESIGFKLADGLQAGLGRVLELLKEEGNQRLLGLLVADSLRDEFTRPVTMEAADKLADELDLPTIGQMLAAIVAVNVQAAGPLAQRLPAAVGSRNAELAGATT